MRKQTNKKAVLVIIRDWNAKVGSQETTGKTGKFGLEVQNEAEQKLTELYQENTLVIANTLSKNPRDDFKHGHHQVGEQDGREVGGCGVHLSSQIYQEYTFRHRRPCRTPVESGQEYLTRGKEYTEPCKTC